MPEKLYTTVEVAMVFGVSYVAVKKWAYSGKIKYIKTPGGGIGIMKARSEGFWESKCQRVRLRFT